MKLRESALWRSFSRHVPPEAMAVRVENSLDGGMPDVLMTCRGKTALIELKAPETVMDLGITRVQADWARRWNAAGGTSWFLISVNRELYLAPGEMGTMLIKYPGSIRRWQVAGHAAAMKTIFGSINEISNNT